MLILMPHGSRDPKWRAPFESMLQTLRAGAGEHAVAIAWMEFAHPSLEEVAREGYARGVRKMALLPLFMSGGGHVDNDIPALVQAVQEICPGLRIEILPPVGQHPRFARLLMELTREHIADR
ncbi:MAG: hypothetical protein GMKNLPBB_01901 [Myxococcota bacterium]|nr:hypothetical protein [Myxococcota bacterium]